MPVLFGLVGFIEPCSIGGSAIFLNYLNRLEPARRVAEATQFVLTRAVFLGGFGLAAAYVGARVGIFQRGYDVAMGALFIVGGLAWFFAQRGGLSLPDALNVTRLLQPKPGKGAALGVAFGLSAPLCAAPLILAILGASLAGASAAWGGFVMMALFGLALSAPLLALALVPRAHDRLRSLSSRVGGRAPLIALLAMLVIGAYLIWAGLVQDPLGVASMDWMGPSVPADADATSGMGNMSGK